MTVSSQEAAISQPLSSSEKILLTDIIFQQLFLQPLYPPPRTDEMLQLCALRSAEGLAGAVEEEDTQRLAHYVARALPVLQQLQVRSHERKWEATSRETEPGIERTANKVSNGIAAPAVGVFLKPVQ